MKLSSIESSKVPPSEKTPFGLSSGGPVTQGANESPRRSLSFQVLVSSILLICFGFTAYTRQSSLSAPSSVVNLTTSVSLLDEVVDDLTGSELDTDITSVPLSDEETENKLTITENGQPGIYYEPALYPKFPSGVFENSPKNVADNTYMRLLKQRCYGVEDRDSNEELACLLYFQNPDISSEQVSFALGTLKTKADIFKITINGKLRQGDVSMLFKDYALAAMIDKGCFMWSTENGVYEETSYSYINEKDYTNAAEDSTSIKVDGSANYWGVTVSAGYESASSDSSSDSDKTRTAFGEKKYSAPVGSIRNTCFNTKQNFQDEIKDLVKPEWVDRWEKIRSATTVDEVVALGDDFTKVADGGFFMPTKYKYEVMVASTLKTKYTSSSRLQTTSASKAITAGLQVDFATAGGSVETAIKQEAETASSEDGYTSIVDVKIISSGNGIDIQCVYKTEGIGACSTIIVKGVKRIRNNIATLGTYPSSQSTFLTLNDMVKWYFNDDDVGLPEVFRQAVLLRYPNKLVFENPDKTSPPTPPPTRQPTTPTAPPCVNNGWTKVLCQQDGSYCFKEFAFTKPGRIGPCIQEKLLERCQESCFCCQFLDG